MTSDTLILVFSINQIPLKQFCNEGFFSILIIARPAKYGSTNLGNISPNSFTVVVFDTLLKYRDLDIVLKQS